VSRGSTVEVQGLYPWLFGASLPAAGAYIGVDCLTGGAFCCHPLEWLDQGLVSNPNIALTGLPGSGKSATIKTLGERLMTYGVAMFVAGDLKNEYAPLARALGTEPIELGPGLPGRLNPLDAGPLGDHLPADPAELTERLAEIHRRRLTLLSSLLTMRLGRALTPTEEAALSLAVHEASGQQGRWPEGKGAGQVRGGARLASPTIPHVWALLRDPLPDMAAELRVSGPVELREMIRPVADALGNMVRGSLSGLFDGPTTVRPDFAAPIQTVDLSRISDRGDETVAMTLACVSSWAQAAIDEPGGPVRMIVRDELWRSLRIPALIRKIDSDLRLSRAQGTIQVLATHRLADFEAADLGTAEASIAANLIASCDTRVCLRQDTAPLAMTREAIGLTDTECAHISSWTGQQAGRAIWKIGRAASVVVQTVLTPAERQLFWTNERMAV
jgi:type IV secretory pathway VirB4 component